MTITLSKEQLEYAKVLAAKRHEAKDISFRNSKRLHGNIKKTKENPSQLFSVKKNK